MYIYQSGKLYLREDNHLIGVEIYPNRVDKILGTETEFTKDFEVINSFDVCEKFGITETTPYKFPVQSIEKEVVTSEPIDIAEKSVRGRPRKK